MSAMTDEPITLEFIARQQQRLLDEMGSMREEMGTMRDDMQVPTAMVMRLDGTVGLVLTELRAMHVQHQRLANRLRRVEERSASRNNGPIFRKRAPSRCSKRPQAADMSDVLRFVYVDRA
jgi:hypothetical protein